MECAPCAARPPSGKCEDCSQKRPTFGVPGEVPKNRWCKGCAQKHTGAVSMQQQATCEDCTGAVCLLEPARECKCTEDPDLRAQTAHLGRAGPLLYDINRGAGAEAAGG